LELFEIVSADAPFYAEYKLKFLKPVDQVVQSFDPDRRDFLERLFNAGSKGRDWLTLDMLSVPTTINEQKLRIVKALEYLEGLGTIELKVGGLRHGFKKNDSSSNLGSSKDIAEKLSELFLKREQRDISRLYSVVDLINNPKCLSQQVLEYFGEASESVCGACSHCRGENLAPLCPLPEKGLTSQEIARLAEIKSQNHPALIQPRQIARFFCGLASPALARSPLKSHPDYGSFAETSFKSVLNAVESLGR
jgi:ATP-dependent DNA helicase RecQ